MSNKDIEFSSTRYDEMGLRPQDFVDRVEYERRLRIIDSAITATLQARDTFFGGTDGVEGVLVVGSYAKSHESFGGRIWVHRKRGAVKASDLDTLQVLSLPSGERSHLSEDQLQAYQAAVRVNNYRRARDIMLYEAALGFPIALERQLRRLSLSISVDQISDDLDLTDPSEHWTRELANDPDADNPVLDAGLLFIAAGSQYRDEIVRRFESGNLPTVLNPVNESRRIR